LLGQRLNYMQVIAEQHPRVDSQWPAATAIAQRHVQTWTDRLCANNIASLFRDDSEEKRTFRSLDVDGDIHGNVMKPGPELES